MSVRKEKTYNESNAEHHYHYCNKHVGSRCQTHLVDVTLSSKVVHRYLHTLY